MPSLYLILKFLHMVADFAFVLAHGASVAVSFKIKQEREPERIKAMLDVSGIFWGQMMLSMLVLLVLGIITGYMGKWWGQGWIWLSLVLLLVLVVWMFTIGQGTYHPLRKALGMPYIAQGKPKDPEEPKPAEEIEAIIAKTNPNLMLWVAAGGFVVILYLMSFKPF